MPLLKSFRLWLCMLAMMPAAGMALPQPMSAVSSHGDTTLTAPAATAVTNELFERYTPHACAAFAGRLEAITQRNMKLSNRLRYPNTDSAAADRAWRVAQMQQCVSHLRINTTPTNHLLALGAAYVAADDYVRADSAFERLFADHSQSPITTRASDMASVVGMYADTIRVKLNKSLGYLARLDSLGAAAGTSRLTAHHVIYLIATQLDTIPLMEAQVAAGERINRELTGPARRPASSGLMFLAKDKADLAARLGKFENAVAILRAAKTELAPFDPTIPMFLNMDLSDRFEMYGKEAPLLRTTFTYVEGKPAPNATAGRPTRGKVAMVTFVDPNDRNDYHVSYALESRLATEYGPRGLEATAVATTARFARNQFVADSAEEAALIAAYVHDNVKLPIPLVIYARHFTKDPIDGSYTGSEDLNTTPYGRGYPYLGLIDKRGRIRYIARWGDHPILHRRIENMVKEFLAEEL